VGFPWTLLLFLVLVRGDFLYKLHKPNNLRNWRFRIYFSDMPSLVFPRQSIPFLRETNRFAAHGGL
jgi:hypothetical protein